MKKPSKPKNTVPMSANILSVSRVEDDHTALDYAASFSPIYKPSPAWWKKPLNRTIRLAAVAELLAEGETPTCPGASPVPPLEPAAAYRF